MNNLIIREYKEEDFEKIYKIYSYYVEKSAVTFECEIPTKENFRTRINKIKNKYPYLVAIMDDNLCGFTYAHEFHERKAYDWACETTIYLDNNYRYMGIGYSLYTKLENCLKKMGITNLYACLGYAQKEDEFLNNASPRFHEKMGYKVVGTFHKCGYKFGNWYDMIWTEKIINEHKKAQPRIVNFNCIDIK